MNDFLIRKNKRVILSNTTFSMQVKALADSHVCDDSHLSKESIIKKPIFSISIEIKDINFNFSKETLDIIGYLTYKM